uniref:Uncharacterized protein n=1 Tax=Timema tahoe TaxID=61484 RepID=A0A7R9FMD8_9NEOP|nr:unnamed protein product [Timema tahoe]
MNQHTIILPSACKLDCSGSSARSSLAASHYNQSASKEALLRATSEWVCACARRAAGYKPLFESHVRDPPPPDSSSVPADVPTATDEPERRDASSPARLQEHHGTLGRQRPHSNLHKMDPPPDPRLEYIGSYVTKTLKLKPEKWGRLVATDELKSMVCEFLNFPEPLVLVILQNSAAQLQVATSFPLSLKSKAAYFIKKRRHPVPKEDISDHLILGDMATKPIEQLAALVDERRAPPHPTPDPDIPPLLGSASPSPQAPCVPPTPDPDIPTLLGSASPFPQAPTVDSGGKVIWPLLLAHLELVSVSPVQGGVVRLMATVFSVQVFVPLLSNRGNHKSWPPVVAQDVQKHVHSLKSTVYQVKGQVSGHTVLPMPVGVERVHEAESMLIKSGGEVVDLYLKSAIEGVVIKWSKQINDVLAEDSSQAFAGGQNPVPTAGEITSHISASEDSV